MTPKEEPMEVVGEEGMRVSDSRMRAFIRESNRIEGILRVTEYEEVAHAVLLSLTTLTVEAVEGFVREVAARPLRDYSGGDVRVGSHYPPPGGPGIRDALTNLLREVSENRWTPYRAHVEYELLHPFMDGNGRSGRAIWAWHMQQDGQDPFALPFLHRFYYQALDEARQSPTPPGSQP